MMPEMRELGHRDPVVRLVDLERVFPGFPEVHALRPFSLDIFEGDFLMIVGPSGSGKSTFLNVLGLLDRPTSGRYLLKGQDVSALSERARAALRGHEIGFVFQSLQLMENRSSIENVFLATAYQGLSYRQSELRVREALDSVGLSSKSDTLVSRLSGGERQRVAIARALAGNAALLLCDEPTGNLDTASSEEVLKVLLELNRQGATIVLITHNPSIAAKGSRQAVIRDGVVSQVGYS
jgi:putative ABC transport system ATP-binding protein